MAKNRKRYQRSLHLGTIVSVLILGVVGASVACGFVGIKNSHVERIDRKRQLENEIRSLEKEVETIALRVSRAHDRQQLAGKLGALHSNLIPIQASEVLTGMPVIPTGLALSKNSEAELRSAVSRIPSG